MIWKRWRTKLEQHVRRHPGQSLVEFTILLPVLLIMISGLIEFGFLLNYYLDLIDAAREAARWGASADAFVDINGAYVGDGGDNIFYGQVAAIALESIDTGSGGQISLDSASDDIVISVFSVVGGTVEQRFPASEGDNGRCVYTWGSGCNHDSAFLTTCTSTSPPTWTCDPPDDDKTSVTALLDPAAPDSGIVSVEIWYDYHMILGLPWITAFVPDPVTLYAYSMMPNPVAQAPTPTP